MSPIDSEESDHCRVSPCSFSARSWSKSGNETYPSRFCLHSSQLIRRSIGGLPGGDVGEELFAELARLGDAVRDATLDNMVVASVGELLHVSGLALWYVIFAAVSGERFSDEAAMLLKSGI